MQNLKDCAREEWDAVIREELAFADIECFRDPGCDLPTYHPKQTLTGKVGPFPMHRKENKWIMWCKVPLASAEVIAADSVCRAGMHTFDGRSVDNPLTYICWIDAEGYALAKDEGYSEEYKQCIISDGRGDFDKGTRFVDAPERDGVPFVMGYDFHTVEALKRFKEILRRHRVV